MLTRLIYNERFRMYFKLFVDSLLTLVIVVLFTTDESNFIIRFAVVYLLRVLVSVLLEGAAFLYYESKKIEYTENELMPLMTYDETQTPLQQTIYVFMLYAKEYDIPTFRFEAHANHFTALKRASSLKFNENLYHVKVFEGIGGVNENEQIYNTKGVYEIKDE